MSVQAARRVIVFSRGVYVALGIAALGYVLYLLRDVLTPIFLAFTIAYILDPVVDRLESWKLPRPLGIAVVLLAFLGAVTLFLLLVLPDVINDIAAVVRELPAKAKDLLNKVEPWLAQRGVNVPHTADEWIAKLQGQANSAASSLLAPAGNALKWVIGGTMSVLGAALAAVIVPILAVYLLNDFDRMTVGIRELIPLRLDRRDFPLHGEVAGGTGGADRRDRRANDGTHCVLDRIERPPAIELDEGQAGHDEEHDQKDGLSGMQCRQRWTSSGRWRDVVPVANALRRPVDRPAKDTTRQCAH